MAPPAAPASLSHPFSTVRGMLNDLIVIDGYRPTAADDTNLRKEAWSFALEQRMFGPRRLLVAVADTDGTLRGLAHARRTDPPERALEPCLRFLQDRDMAAPVAVAFCDEPVIMGPPDPDVADRFAEACAVAESLGVHLVDWFACDSLAFRSFRLALHPEDEWWNVPRA